ncbi:hypothetical protein C8Q73DRAFT_659679 [Cubamyces lactineus]|nr:hypothetical protein C8Q73DRAFT_659679 [Cubamyces lactineus]
MEEARSTRFVSTKDFLDKIIPVDSDALDRIYDALIQSKDKLYASTRWKGFPRPEAKYKELDLYPAFTKTANAIAKVARDVVGEHEDQVREAIWVDYHSKVPQTLEEGATLIRPDCALAMAFADPSEAPSEKSDKLRWLQFVAAVEAKRDYEQKDKELISQLLTYLRVMMVEQKDRRFALGLFLSNMQVSVWLQDRSGVLGMDEPINIHENPRDFIQVIAAFAILPAHRLGFDPTMKLARGTLPPIHTYRITSWGNDRFNLEEYKKTNFGTQWVITTEQGVFITLRALSLLRTEVVSGSGCIVWAAIRYEDRAIDPDVRKVFVLKQFWNSDGRVDEGTLYEHLKNVTGDSDAQYIGKFEFHEVVKIGGEIDNTASLIRGGLEPVKVQMEERQQSLKRTRVTDPELDEWLHFQCVDVEGMQLISRFFAGRQQETKPPKRTRVRIVLGVFGCTIKFFSSRQELVSLLLDCVRGHRFAYEHGVVHRDISAGNLLIALRGHDISPSAHSGPQDVRGCLIDFDHAKRTRTVEERKITYDADEIRRLTNMKLYHDYTEEWAEQVTDEVVSRAVHLVKHHYPKESRPNKITQDAVWYIEAALEYYKLSGRAPPPGNVYTPEALGWDGPLLLPPEPIRRHDPERRGKVRSGTLPYISVKILHTSRQLTVRWRDVTFTPSRVVHDAIHDMESLFWVLLFLCITRAGPGGERREDFAGELTDFPKERQDQVARLRNAVRNLFDGDVATIAYYKEHLFQNPQEFETEILRHIHPYFEVLKPTLCRWWDLLVLAYTFEGYEYHNIHAFVIELLDMAARDLASLDDSQQTEDTEDKEKSQKAVEKRINHLRKVTWAFSRSQASRPTSPLSDMTTPEKKTLYQYSSPLSSPPSSPLTKKTRRGD